MSKKVHLQNLAVPGRPGASYIARSASYSCAARPTPQSGPTQPEAVLNPRRGAAPERVELVPGETRKISVGSLAVGCEGRFRGLAAVCYELYDIAGRPGYSFLFEDAFYDGFSPDEVATMLFIPGNTNPAVEGYQFESVAKLSLDIRKGLFGFGKETCYEMAKAEWADWTVEKNRSQLVDGKWDF